MRIVRDNTDSDYADTGEVRYEYDGLDRLVDYRRGKLSGGIVPKSPTDATNLLYRQTWATLDGSGNVTGSKLASHGNWMEWTVDTNGGTAGGSTTQVRNVNSANEIDTDNNDTNANNAITGNSWIDPLYDKSGNMTTAPKGQGSETTAIYFVYDGWGRVAGISATASPDGDFSDAGEVQYEYDGTGRRISKDFAGGTSSDEDTYWNESFQALETRKAGSSFAYEQTVYDLRYIDAPILRYRDANASNDNVLEEVLYVTYDANFNITGLVKEDQTFVERFVNTPFGDRLVLTGTFGTRTGTSYDWWQAHQGLRIDPESGTYHNRARQLHSGLGSFTARDPKLTEYQDGMSLYQAYRGNPVVLRDSTGMSVEIDMLREQGLLRKPEEYHMPHASPLPTTPMAPASTPIPAVHLPGYLGVTNTINAILELQFLVTQANNWNSSSPGWLLYFNECAEQASRLQAALQIYLPNLKYWQPATDSGAANSTGWSYHHHVVVLKPTKDNALGPVVIDMFKQGPEQMPQACKIMSATAFRASYPYTCDCCKSHVIPVKAPPTPPSPDPNPWRYWHP